MIHWMTRRPVGVLVLLLGGTPPVAAADWFVDQRNCPGGSGAPSDPFCTIGQALAVAQDGDRVLIAPGTYVENLVLTADVTLVGSLLGATILDGGYQDRVLDVPAGTSAELRWLLIERGRHFDPWWGHGGGIRNAGDLTLRFCVIRSNVASANPYLRPGDVLAQGGAIYNTGTLLLESCTVADNGCGATAFAGREQIEGVGIYSSGALVMNGCTVMDHDAATDHIASQGVASGGGIHSSGTLDLTNCTVARNTLQTTASYGAGIAALGPTTLTSCTVAENSASGSIQGGDGSAYGGGIGGNVAMSHCLIAYNCVSTDGWIYQDGPDVYGTVTSGGYLLIQDPSGATIIGDPTGNQYRVDPLLTPLVGRGGPVWTYGLQPASPALDAGHPDPLALPPVDARNHGRAATDPTVGAADLGAYEAGASPSLLLASTPAQVPLGASFQLTSSGGWPTELLYLFLVEVGGVPTFLPVTRGPIDFQGVWALPGTAPSDPSVSGLSVKLRGLSLSPFGRFWRSNDATLTFQ